MLPQSVSTVNNFVEDFQEIFPSNPDLADRRRPAHGLHLTQLMIPKSRGFSHIFWQMWESARAGIPETGSYACYWPLTTTLRTLPPAVRISVHLPNRCGRCGLRVPGFTHAAIV